LRIADYGLRILRSCTRGETCQLRQSAIRNPKSAIVRSVIGILAGLLLLPSVALAAEGSGDKWGPWLTIGRFFNLALVIGVVVWVARKPLASFFAGRTQSIQEQLAAARKAREEAEAKLAEIESQMSHLDEELRDLEAAAEKEAQDEYQRLLAETQRDADKIVERARQEIDGLTRTAQMELKAHVAQLSVRLAEEGIRREITDQDRDRLFMRFVTKLGAKQ
jgi:F-type H+-transporting ATPase subunit b